MTKEMVKVQKLQKRAKKRKQAERTLDHPNPVPEGSDLERTVEQEKVELKHREKAKEEFRHS